MWRSVYQKLLRAPGGVGRGEKKAEDRFCGSYFFVYSGPDGGSDCSSSGKLRVYKRRAGDAQTNDSTMTNDAEITDTRVTYWSQRRAGIVVYISLVVFAVFASRDIFFLPGSTCNIFLKSGRLFVNLCNFFVTSQRPRWETVDRLTFSECVTIKKKKKFITVLLTIAAG